MCKVGSDEGPAGRRVRHPDSSCYSSAHGGGGSSRWQQGTTSWSLPEHTLAEAPVAAGSAGAAGRTGAVSGRRGPGGWH